MTQITPQMVKSLRDRTGAGMMDCKKALVDTSGNEDDAIELIQKKGLAKVAKKAGAIAAEGMIHSYIHSGSRLGVLLEVNCQTDFVARNEEFREFVDGVGLQIASMGAEYVRREEISEADIAAKRSLFLGQLQEEEAKSGKKRPEAAIDKIIDGKLNKWMTETCLVDQPSVQDDDGRTIQTICEALSAKIGEKISIRRFVRYQLGEGIEKKKTDLAAEVAETLANN